MAKNWTQREVRSRISRVKNAIADAGDVNHLNITAMMDMMSILLVFMLKQFSVESSNLNVSDQLQLPKSTSALKLSPAVNVSVTTNAIIIEGDPVAPVRNGAVDPSAKRDGANGYYITPIVDTLQKHANRLKKIAGMQGQEFDSTMLLLVDRATPYRLVTEVLYSAGQAEFRNYRLVVLSAND